MLQKGHRKSQIYTAEAGVISWVLIFVFSSFHSSAFFVFCSDHRPKIKEDNPGISIGEIAKKLGELWSKQSPKDKAPYEARAAKLKEKYEKVLVENLVLGLRKATPP